MEENRDFIIKTVFIALAVIFVYLIFRDNISSFVDWVFQRQIDNILNEF